MAPDEQEAADDQDLHDEIPTSGCTACGTTNLDPPCNCSSTYSLQAH